LITVFAESVGSLTVKRTFASVKNAQIGIVGGGSWATALSKLLLNNVPQLHWWMRNLDQIEKFKQTGHNPGYLTEVHFNLESIIFHNNLKSMLQQVDVLVVAVPAAYLEDAFDGFENSDFIDKEIFCATKGITPVGNYIPPRFFHKKYRVPYDNLGIISGPCHAEEVAEEKLSYLTIAGLDEEKVEQMAGFLKCDYLKTVTSTDLFGTANAAVLKNIYAIAVGVAEGLGYGVNFQAVLVANTIQEMGRFLDAVSPVHRDMSNSAYVGDLLVTAYSDLSRNRKLGVAIGSGKTPAEALASTHMVAEGYFSVKSVVEMNKEFNVSLPIAEGVYEILYENASPKEIMRRISGGMK
jgi:glycerol-3-phosphate dehydrogenase (NAD(P)+)